MAKESSSKLLYLGLGLLGGVALSMIFTPQVKGVWDQIPVVGTLDDSFGGGVANYANAYNAISLEGRHMSYN